MRVGVVIDTKKIALILMTLSFILIMAGSVSSFLKGLQKDRVTTYNRIHEVNDEFEVFSTNTSVFEETRDELYTVVFNNIYYDTMFQEDVDVKNKLSNYEHLVDEMEKNMMNLKNLCNNIYYPSIDTNNKCKNYKTIYEQVVNYFVSDIHLYNRNIQKYNEYQKSLGSLYLLQDYHTKREYIDYNNDNVYDGKEE